MQEYGRPNPGLTAGLESQGRHVTAVPVYQWQLPSDLQPLELALQLLLDDDVHATLFTTGVQVDHFLEFADRQGKHDQAVEALRRTFVASIGPDCTEALRQHGMDPSFEPSHPKMGILVRESAEAYGPRILNRS